MEHIRPSGYDNVLRNCGFAALGIVAAMTATSFDPRLALEIGGFLTILMAFVLVLKSNRVLTDSEPALSGILDSNEASARRAGAEALDRTLLTFAMWASFASILLWLLVVIVSLFGTANAADAELRQDERLSVSEAQAVATRATAADLRRISFRYQFLL